jgi:hypothetical protein
VSPIVLGIVAYCTGEENGELERPGIVAAGQRTTLTSIAEEKSGVGAQDPIVRQTVMEGTAFLAVGKPLILGSIDIPGSTRRLDIEVVMEQVVNRGEGVN